MGKITDSKKLSINNLKSINLTEEDPFISGNFFWNAWTLWSTTPIASSQNTNISCNPFYLGRIQREVREMTRNCLETFTGCNWGDWTSWDTVSYADSFVHNLPCGLEYQAKKINEKCIQVGCSWNSWTTAINWTTSGTFNSVLPNCPEEQTQVNRQFSVCALDPSLCIWQSWEPYSWTTISNTTWSASTTSCSNSSTQFKIIKGQRFCDRELVSSCAPGDWETPFVIDNSWANNTTHSGSWNNPCVIGSWENQVRITTRTCNTIPDAFCGWSDWNLNSTIFTTPFEYIGNTAACPAQEIQHALVSRNCEQLPGCNFGNWEDGERSTAPGNYSGYQKDGDFDCPVTEILVRKESRSCSCEMVNTVCDWDEWEEEDTIILASLSITASSPDCGSQLHARKRERTCSWTNTCPSMSVWSFSSHNVISSWSDSGFENLCDEKLVRKQTRTCSCTTVSDPCVWGCGSWTYNTSCVGTSPTCTDGATKKECGEYDSCDFSTDWSAWTNVTSCSNGYSNGCHTRKCQTVDTCSAGEWAGWVDSPGGTCTPESNDCGTTKQCGTRSTCSWSCGSWTYDSSCQATTANCTTNSWYRKCEEKNTCSNNTWGSWVDDPSCEDAYDTNNCLIKTCESFSTCECDDWSVWSLDPDCVTSSGDCGPTKECRNIQGCTWSCGDPFYQPSCLPVSESCSIGQNIVKCETQNTCSCNSWSAWTNVSSCSNGFTNGCQTRRCQWGGACSWVAEGDIYTSGSDISTSPSCTHNALKVECDLFSGQWWCQNYRGTQQRQESTRTCSGANGMHQINCIGEEGTIREGRTRSCSGDPDVLRKSERTESGGDGLHSSICNADVGSVATENNRTYPGNPTQRQRSTRTRSSGGNGLHERTCIGSVDTTELCEWGNWTGGSWETSTLTNKSNNPDNNDCQEGANNITQDGIQSKTRSGTVVVAYSWTSWSNPSWTWSGNVSYTGNILSCGSGTIDDTQYGIQTRVRTGEWEQEQECSWNDWTGWDWTYGEVTIPSNNPTTCASELTTQESVATLERDGVPNFDWGAWSSPTGWTYDTVTIASGNNTIVCNSINKTQNGVTQRTRTGETWDNYVWSGWSSSNAWSWSSVTTKSNNVVSCNESNVDFEQEAVERRERVGTESFSWNYDWESWEWGTWVTENNSSLTIQNNNPVICDNTNHLSWQEGIWKERSLGQDGYNWTSWGSCVWESWVTVDSGIGNCSPSWTNLLECLPGSIQTRCIEEEIEGQTTFIYQERTNILSLATWNNVSTCTGDTSENCISESDENNFKTICRTSVRDGEILVDWTFDSEVVGVDSCQETSEACSTSSDIDNIRNLCEERSRTGSATYSYSWTEWTSWEIVPVCTENLFSTCNGVTGGQTVRQCQKRTRACEKI